MCVILFEIFRIFYEDEIPNEVVRKFNVWQILMEYQSISRKKVQAMLKWRNFIAMIFSQKFRENNYSKLPNNRTGSNNHIGWNLNFKSIIILDEFNILGVFFFLFFTCENFFVKAAFLLKKSYKRFDFTIFFMVL